MSELTPKQFKEDWDKGERPVLIDVREQDEWDLVNLEEYGARLLPLSQFRLRMNEVPKDQDVVMQCRSGGRRLLGYGHQQPPASSRRAQGLD